MFCRCRLLMILVGVLSAEASGQLRLPALLSDHMVLQQDAEVPIWGWDDPGTMVTVQASWTSDVQTAQADASGSWRVLLATARSARPQTLIIEGSSKRRLEDVLLGEVWVASGQSNMMWPLEATPADPAPRSSAGNSQLRFFKVGVSAQRDVQEDCSGRWIVATPSAAARFSAVAYHFGMELQDRLQLPVGLIGSYVGFTRIEGWISEETHVVLGDHTDLLPRTEGERSHPGSGASQIEAEKQAWWERVRRIDPGTRDGWAEPDHDLSRWVKTEQPSLFGDAGLKNFDGVVWLRKSIMIPSGWVGRDLILRLGPIDDMATTWFNGTRIGGEHTEGLWTTPRVYAVSGALVRGEEVAITVRIIDTGGAGGFAGIPADLTLGLAQSDDEDELSLSGTWRLRRGASMKALGSWPAWPQEAYLRSPTAYYNGMIAPLTHFPVAGALWYHGESNVDEPHQYARLLPAMIADWRGHWRLPNLPFYFVQITPFRYPGDGRQAARLREAQRLSLSSPHTGMVVTLDIGDVDELHPPNKREVGLRLAQLALAQTYGQDKLVFSGPLLRGTRQLDEALVLEFDHADGLWFEGDRATQFELAGSDLVFHPATAEIVGGSVILTSTHVAKPAQARYAWSDDGKAELFNGAGLPASPFHTQWRHP